MHTSRRRQLRIPLASELAEEAEPAQLLLESPKPMRFGLNWRKCRTASAADAGQAMTETAPQRAARPVKRCPTVVETQRILVASYS